MPFGASLRETEIGSGFLVRDIKSSGPVAIRSELSVTKPAIAYLFPCSDGNSALFDGLEATGRTIASRMVGHTPSLRTFGPNEIANFTITLDILEPATEALAGKPGTSLLVTHSTIVDGGNVGVSRLRALHRILSDAAERCHESDVASPALFLMRDEVLAVLVKGLAQTNMKPDHRARQLQTRSMARIDRHLDDHRMTVVGLQDLCAGTGLPLRTVETIIRSRTGLPALDYLRRRRLAFVREALLKPASGATVTSVAMQFGFWHLGRFSQYYFQAYGELPSTTISRALGHRRGLDRYQMTEPSSAANHP